MGIMTGNPQQEPMHYGEVFGVWSFLLAEKSKIAAYQTFINHSGDQDLRRFLENVINNTLRPEVQELEMLLKENGIQLPPAPPERPHADLNSIPPGAKINDPEIAATLAVDHAASLTVCSQIIGQSTREDIALMFGQFHMRKAKDGATLLRINKDKGWLVPPPLHLQEEKVAVLA